MHRFGPRSGAITLVLSIYTSHFIVISLLVGVQVVNGLLLPINLFFIWRLSRSERVMGKFRSGKVLGAATGITVVVTSTLSAVLVVITLGLILRSKATSGVPGKFQLLWEMAVGAVQTQVEDSIGPRGAKVVPLALTLFIFIFTFVSGVTLDDRPAPQFNVAIS